MAISVLVADDTPIIRKAIRDLLSSKPEIKVVGEAKDFHETIKLIDDLKPKVVVMDLHMPGDETINSDRLRAQLKQVSSCLVAVSIWDDPETRALAESFGAKQFLDKIGLSSTLLPAIDACL
jgi:DNA-binding NarL/FixJ family response regulator